MAILTILVRQPQDMLARHPFRPTGPFTIMANCSGDSNPFGILGGLFEEQLGLTLSVKSSGGNYILALITD